MNCRSKRFRPGRAAVAIVSALALVFAPLPPALACGGPPPPPACGVVFTFTLGAPEQIVLPPGGGAFEIVIPAIVFVDVFGFGCSTPPFSGTIDLQVADSGGAGAAVKTVGGMTSFPISVSPGPNLIAIPVTVGPTVQRTAEISATASIDLTIAPFGVPTNITVSDTSTNSLCFVDGLASEPTTPRLEIELIDPVNGSDPNLNGLVTAHPSNQLTLTYRITNNDISSFSGILSATSTNDSRLPGVTGDDPVAAGSGVISPSDPAVGDHFPIGLRIGDETWGVGILDCVPHPGNPLALPPQMLSPTLELGAGESKEVELFIASPSGKCADGSCSNGRLFLEGSFSNAEVGFACAGYSMMVDVTLPPNYDCPDSGAILEISPQGAGFTIGARPFTGIVHPLSYTVANLEVTQNGSPIPNPFEFADTLGRADERGRHQVQWFNPTGLLTPGATIQVDYDVTIQPAGSAVTDIVDNMIALMPNAPTGFENQGPFAIGGFTTIGFPAGEAQDGYVTYMSQFSGRFSQFGTSETVHPIIWDAVNVTPTSLPCTAGFHFSGTTTVPNVSGDPFVLFEIYDDIRGYATPDIDVTMVDQIIGPLLGFPDPIGNELDLNSDDVLDAADVVRFVDPVVVPPE